MSFEYYARALSKYFSFGFLREKNNVKESVISNDE